MRQTLSYNIHGILKFKITRNYRRDKLKDLNLPFSFFEIDNEVDEPDIVLNIGKFEPTNRNCYIIDHKYYVGKNYFYCKDSDSGVKWEVEILGFEKGNAVVNFWTKLFGAQLLLSPELLPQILILRPLIEYRLSQKGYFLIHSAAVCKNGKGYLLIGRSGAFKTTFTMDFVRRAGFDFLGDEHVIIHEDTVLSFPMHPAICDFRVRHLPTENLGFLDKIRLTKYLWKNWDYVNTYTKTVRSASLGGLFFLVRTGQKLVRVNRLSLEEAISKVIANNSMEMIVSPTMFGMNFGVCYKYMLAHSFVFPKSSIATYWDHLEGNMRKVLEKIPIYEIEVPLKYEPSIFAKVHKIVTTKMSD